MLILVLRLVLSVSSEYVLTGLLVQGGGYE